MSRISPQLICFSYHKSGTTLLWHVMTKISERLGLRLVNHYGLVERLDLEPDLILLPHSVLRAPLDRPYRAIRLIRDPRDIWVSGYLYHLRCDEGWCVCTDTNRTAPIQWPQVDYSVLHWPEDWKLSYLDRLGGKSYQQNLLDRSLADGLDFELEGYTGCTLAAMREWKLNGADALDMKLEEVMADFDGAMLGIFDHFGFTADQSEAALEVARSEDVRRMDDAAIADRPQINSRTISKWRDVLSVEQIARFEQLHGELIHDLGYELSGPPASLPDNGHASARHDDAGYLASATRYLPVDVVRRDERTTVVDFNYAAPPLLAAHAAACLRLLEYLHDVDGLLGKLHAGYRILVLSYNPVFDRSQVKQRRMHGWVNDHSIDQMETMFEANGWERAEVLSLDDGHQMLWKLKRRIDSINDQIVRHAVRNVR